MTDNTVLDEMFRVNHRTITRNGWQHVMSDFEESVDLEILKWAQQNVDKDPGLKYHNSQYAIHKFWNERLN